MVDILIDWQQHEFDFNGEVVAMELLSMDVVISLMLSEVNIESRKDKQVEITTKIFERCVRNIRNLTINGKPVTAEQLANTLQLIELANAVIERLIKISHISRPDKKKLDRQSTLQQPGEVLTN